MEMAEKEGAKYKDAYTKDAGAEPVWGQGGSSPIPPRTSLKAKRKEEEIRERRKKKRKEEE